jgi:ribonuclease inhibitor
MEEKIIDCSRIHSKEDLHKLFRETLSFPEWYGNNLDALHDCLSEISGKVRLIDWEIAQENLGTYGIRARKVITMAALDNTMLDLYL